MGTLSGGPNIVTDGLVLNLDAANIKSYVSGSTTWRDLSRSGNNGTLTNGPTFNAGNGGSIVFDGIDDYSSTTPVSNLTIPQMEGDITYEYWVQPTQATAAGLTQSTSGTSYFSANIPNGLQTNTDYKYYTTGTPNTTNTHAAFMFALGTNGFIAGTHQNSYAPPILVDYRTITGINHLVVVKRQYNASYYLNGLKIKDSSTITRILGDGLGSIVSNNSIITPSTNIFASNRSIYFGRFFKGNIFSYKVYIKELSPQEVLQNYNTTKTRFGL
jgi:hypothetical protein